MMRLALLLVIAALPAFASDWTNSYGGLGRTCYLVSDAVTPPFALAWEFRPDHPLRDAALIAYKRVYLTTKEYYVYALALDSGAADWKFEAPTGLDEAISFDARNGRVRWRHKVSGNVIHTPQTGTDALYVSTEAGILHALSQYNGKEFWGVYLGKPLTMPAVDADLVVVGSGENLLGLRNRDASVLFKVPLGRLPEYFPALGDNLVYVALKDEVLAFDRGGAMKWRYQLHASISAPLAVTSAGVMVGLLDGTLMMLSPQAGALVWDKALAGAPLSIVGAGSVVLAGTSRGTVVCLRLSDGAKLWSYDAVHGPVDGIALTEDHIVVTAGKWVGVFVPAPDPPQLVVVKPAPHAPGAGSEPGADLTWGTGYENGSPVAEYVVWRCKPGGEWRQVGRTDAAKRSFHAPDSDDEPSIAIDTGTEQERLRQGLGSTACKLIVLCSGLRQHALPPPGVNLGRRVYERRVVVPRVVDGQRETEPLTTLQLHGDDAHDATLVVDEGATRVAGVDPSVGLDVADAQDDPRDIGYDALVHRELHPHRIAHDHHAVPRGERRGVGQR